MPHHLSLCPLSSLRGNLALEQLVVFFDRDQSVISRHIRNVCKEGELEEECNMQKMHIPNSDKPVTFYNLDVIISVGDRVKSQRGTQFRQWATQRLKEYLCYLNLHKRLLNEPTKYWIEVVLLQN
jgi:hypothetical protein